MNNCYPCIEFTKDVEENNSLNFLDISITKDNDKFTTSTYKKPTFTGLTMNFHSFYPFVYKLNLIKTLLNIPKLKIFLKMPFLGNVS